MSSTLIHDVCQWSPEQCKETVDSIMPQLIINHVWRKKQQFPLKLICESLESFVKKLFFTDALNTLVNSFLRCFDTHNAEDKFFSKVLCKVPIVFNELLDSIRNPGDSCNDLKKLHEDALEVAGQTLGVLILCMKFFESEVSLDQMYSLPDNILQVLIDSYNLCKESDCIYGEMLELLSESLGLFFRKIQAVQMEFSGLLDRMTLCSGHEKDVQALINLCLRLSDLCQLVSNLDVKIAAVLWKTYTKLIVRYEGCLKDRLDVDEVLKYLCKDSLGRIEELKCYFGGQQEQSQDFHHTVKICSFNLKLLLTICEKFQDYLGESLKDICHLILVLYELSVVCFSCSPVEKPLSDSLLNHLIVAVEPLLLHVSNNRQFLDCVQDTFKADLQNQLRLPFCLLCVSLVGISGDAGESPINERLQLKLFETIFTIIELCELSFLLPLSFPGVMCQGKPQRLVSLYEYLCTHLCAFVATVSAKNFCVLCCRSRRNLREKSFLSSEAVLKYFSKNGIPHVSEEWQRCWEKCMLKVLLHGSDISVCLMSDIWCFLARYGSADLCYAHCSLLARVTTMITDDRAVWVKWLLRRLYGFLLLEQKKKLLQEHSHLEKDTPFCQENEVNEKKWLKGFTILGNEATHLNTHSDIHNLFEELKAVNCLVTRNMSPYVKNVAHQVIRTWSTVLKDLCVTQHGKNIACLLLQIATSLVSVDGGKEILELLQFAENMWLTGSDVVQLSVIFFLKPWASKYISPIPEQKQILGQLASLLAKVISCQHYVLRQEALGAFSELAHSTPHQSIIPECLRIVPQLQKTVTTFLKKEPVEGNLSEDELKNILEQQLQLMKDSKNKNKEENKEEKNFPEEKFSFDIDINEEPQIPEETPAKKQCVELSLPRNKLLGDGSSTSQVSQHVNQLSEVVTKLEALQPLPDWALKDLKLLSQKISSLS